MDLMCKVRSVIFKTPNKYRFHILLIQNHGGVNIGSALSGNTKEPLLGNITLSIVTS